MSNIPKYPSRHKRTGEFVKTRAVHSATRPSHTLVRALSKQGVASRTQSEVLIRAGQVSVNGQICRDPNRPFNAEVDVFLLNGQAIEAGPKRYVLFNKPRGLITTTSDEKGRATIYQALPDELHELMPVGRLDQASEGLLLLSNDRAWSAHLTAPESRIKKIYHVQIACVADSALLQKLQCGVVQDGEMLRACAIEILRTGEKNSWLTFVLDEGKNRHIRRMLAASDVAVLRLIRVQLGELVLGDLAKGQWRDLSEQELAGLT